MSGPWWHYSCDHGVRGIGRQGFAKPVRLWAPRAVIHEVSSGEHGWLADLVWFTDLTPPIRQALGLTRMTIQCDRMAYRYRVTDPANLVPWVTWARRLPFSERAALNFEPGALPMCWWVSEHPVPVVLDQF